MRKAIIYILVSLSALALSGTQAGAQKYPERRMIRQGNGDYRAGNYTDSEVDYRRALEKAPWSYEANYNLGNSLYKQERFEEAAQLFASLDSLGAENAAAAHYNAGNAFLRQRKLDEAIDEYKKSLRINPGDRQAKFNLAYAKKLRDQDKNQNDQNQNDQQYQNNKNDQNDQNNQNNQNNQNQNDQNQNQNDQNQNNDQQPKPQSQQQQQSGMSRQEAERILDAMQMNEDKTREKLDEKKAKAVGRSEKNW